MGWGGPTVNLIITSSLSIEYKEIQPFTVFQTALQNMLILSFLYQWDRIIPQHRINRKQNSFSFPVTHFFFGGGGMFLREIVLVVALQRSLTSCLLVMSQFKIGIVITDL